MIWPLTELNGDDRPYRRILYLQADLGCKLVVVCFIKWTG